MLDDAELRRALTLLRRPDRLVTPAVADVLAARRLVPAGASALATAQAAAAFFRDAIERIRPEQGAGREQQLPYDILRLRFLEGATVRNAARTLGMSERQFSREQAWAVSLLKSELDHAPAPPATPAAPVVAVPKPATSVAGYRPEPIPTLDVYLPRDETVEAVDAALTASRFVQVWGAPGLGKTTTLGHLAARRTATHRVLWYRVRPGVNDAYGALLYELGDHLAATGDDRVAAALADHDPTLAARVALKALAGTAHLLVIDGYHHLEHDPATGGFLDEVVARVPGVEVVLVSRRAAPAPPGATVLTVAPLDLEETRRLLTLHDVEVPDDVAKALHEWTGGVPQLVTLAAAWVKTTDGDIDAALDELSGVAAVHDFLLGTLTELIDPDDRAILNAACVFRDRFSDSALAAVADRSRGAVMDAINRLVRSHVAVRSRNGENAFFHSTVRQFVYDRLPPAERDLLHRRAAAWHVTRGNVAEAAYHSEQAGLAT